MQQFRCVEFSSDNHELLETATWLRSVVWNKHVGREVFAESVWTDDHDCHACHWGILNHGNRMVAAARLCVHDSIEKFPDYYPGNTFACEFVSPIAMMNRLVVHPDFQRQGLASRLDMARIVKAISLHCRSIVIEVPSYRMHRLEKMGFEYVGETVDITNIQQAGIQFYLYKKVLTSCKGEHFGNQQQL